MAATAPGLGRHREHEPVEQVQPGTERAAGARGTAREVADDDVERSPELTQGGLGGEMDAGQRTAAAGQDGHRGGKRPGPDGRARAASGRAKSSSTGPPDGEPGGDVEGDGVGVHHADPGRQRGVAGQARGDVRRDASLALGMLGGGNAHGESRHNTR